MPAVVAPAVVTEKKPRKPRKPIEVHSLLFTTFGVTAYVLGFEDWFLQYARSEKHEVALRNWRKLTKVAHSLNEHYKLDLGAVDFGVDNFDPETVIAPLLRNLKKLANADDNVKKERRAAKKAAKKAEVAAALLASVPPPPAEPAAVVTAATVVPAPPASPASCAPTEDSADGEESDEEAEETESESVASESEDSDSELAKASEIRLQNAKAAYESLQAQLTSLQAQHAAAKKAKNSNSAKAILLQIKSMDASVTAAAAELAAAEKDLIVCV